MLSIINHLSYLKKFPYANTAFIIRHNVLMHVAVVYVQNPYP